jgi:hypothetical protein
MNFIWHERACRTKQRVTTHRVGLGSAAQGCGEGETRKSGRLTSCHSSCLPAAGNSLAISSCCHVPTPSRRAMACSSSFRCGHLTNIKTPSIMPRAEHEWICGFSAGSGIYVVAPNFLNILQFFSCKSIKN